MSFHYSIHERSTQYGFRKEHSTDLACVEIVDRIIQHLDNNETPINIYLDLSKAFDTLDHKILLAKLKFYGISGIAYSLFESYLSNRKQYVEYEDINSEIREIKTGVPQGSVLGPLLFIIYMNDISKSSTLFDFITYADDTTLNSVISTFSDNRHNTNFINTNVNSELNKISEWLKINKLSLNVKKTKFMIFHTLNKNVSIPDIHINNTPIACVNNFNFLGLHLDRHMTWKTHIDMVAGKISRSIGILNRLKYYLPLEIKKLLYNSLILSHLNYAILLWGFKNERLAKLHKKAIRIITLNRYNAHTDPIFKSLNILKLNDIFILNQLKFYHKLINNNLPKYFYQFQINENRLVHQHYTRTASCIHTLKVNHTFAKKCIRYNLPVIINNTKKNIKEKVYTHSLKGFSTYIKKICIDKYQSTCNERNCYVCTHNI